MTVARDIRGRNVTVIGAARSGVAAARLLSALGARVFLSEQAGKDACASAAAELTALGAASEFGAHSERSFDADICVTSPGVPSDAPVIAEMRRRDIPVISELELGWAWAERPTVAVTGTNGKTTTTALCGSLLAEAGFRTAVAGNIGIPLCDVVADGLAGGHAGETGAGLPERIALEVSSYQLDHCVDFRPDVAVLTTITPDHLARYGGDFARYIESKKRVYQNQTAGDAIVYNADSAVCVDAVSDASSRRFPVSSARALETGAWMEGGQLVMNAGGGAEPIAPADALRIRGRHNVMNTLMAALAARLLGADAGSIARAARAFPGVEHRLEHVRDRAGVTWINDSKATNVDSVVIALQSIDRPVVLIAGGRDKEAPYDPMVQLVAEKVLAMILIGEAADRMERAFAAVTEIHRVVSMEEAVVLAAALARSGQVVLLSPACASFDMYENFEQRGRDYKQLVRNLPAEDAA